MNKVVLFLISILFTAKLSAQFQAAPVLSPQDTMFISYELDKGISYHHTIKPKQTIYSIAKYFNTPIQELLIHNDLSDPTTVGIGQEIMIPIDTEAFSYEIEVEKAAVPVIYKVKAKETLFRLSKVYFPQSIDQMVERNNLAQLSLSLDQEMIIGFFYIDRSQISHPEEVEESITLQDTIMQIIDEETDQLVEVPEKLYHKRGIAIWNKNGSDKVNAFVLHKEAKVNSFIEIHNPIVNRKTIAKVVGKLPEDLYSGDVTMIMSPKVAEALGALDSRLMVEMNYD